MRKGEITFSFKFDLDKLSVPDRLKLLIHRIVREIQAKCANGDYIFRGESRKFTQVSSTLYRKCKKIAGEAADAIDIEVVQANLLRQAMDHDLNDPAKVKKRPDIYKFEYNRMDGRFIEKNFEVLTEIQHWGGETNLIDFTEDYKVALFFACESDYDCDGRVILKNKESVQELIRIPKEPQNRVEAQKSVFILPHKGFIEIDPNLVVSIPKDLKTVVMKLLLLHKPQVIEEKIYGDLHGFIKIEERYQRADIIFLQGLDFEKKAKNTEDKEQKNTFCKKAIECYEKLIEEMPSFQQAHFRCARLYGMLGELEKATHRAKEATEWQPHDRESFGLLGKCYFDRGNFELAIINFNAAIQLNRDYTEGYIMRGDAYSFCNNNKLAIKDYSKAIELKPDNYRPYVNRGMVYLEEREPDLAINDCTKALQLKPDNYYAFINRGNAYLQKGEFGLAIKDFNAAIELNSGKFPVFACRGYAYLKKGDYDRSANDFCKALELEPNYHIAHLYLGKIYGHKGKLNQAEIYYSKLIDIDHDVDASNYHLFIVPNGKTNVFHKQDLEAEGHICRAAVYLRMQQWEKARVDIIATQGTKAKSDWFKNIHNSVEDFEKKYGVTIPKDLVKLLSSPS